MMEHSYDAADHLLDEVRALRGRARADRHAFGYPLVFFGALTVFSAILQTIADALRFPPGGALAHLLPKEFVDMVWVSGLIAGTGLTVWHYHRHGYRTGIQTAVRRPGVLGGLAVAVPLLSLLLPFDGAPFYLLTIGLGLVALACVEHSRHLWIVVGLYAAAIVPAVASSGIHLYERLLERSGLDGLLGPRETALLLPAAVLLVAGLLAQRKTRP
ncbi:hypothetical protein ACI2LC_37935 [Nonomuraea wenchangensis]|uniref:hypothetical protein n=1 Tax=Nonomuraea wenchangensis TaxID=568860 RepID=UPI0033E4C823